MPACNAMRPPATLCVALRAGSIAGRPRQAQSGGIEPLPGWYDFRALRLLETCRGPAGLAGHKKVATPRIPKDLTRAWTNVNTASELDAVMPFLDNE